MSVKKIKNSLKGGDLIASLLKSHGIRTVACLSGTAHTHLLLALEDYEIKILSSRHETATIAIADGYARVSGKLGVALIKADQGIPNAMSGILTANQACSPVVVIVSLLPDTKRESSDEWPNDWLDMVKPYVKWARTVPALDRLEEFLDSAIRHSMRGRPGVSVLAIPQQFEGADVEESHYVHNDSINPVVPNPNSIKLAAEALKESQNPMILVGSGAALSSAGEALRKFSESHRYPVLGNALGRGLVPEDMRLGFPWPLAQVAAKESDTVMVVGMRLTERIGYGLSPRFNFKAKFIQIDVEPEEIGRNRFIDIPIWGDARLSIEALDNELKIKNYKQPSGYPVWVNRSMESRISKINSIGSYKDDLIHPYLIARELAKQMPTNAIYVGDGADIQNWMHAILRIKSERSFIDHYPLGSMGIGTPLSIGAAAAARDMAEKNGSEVRPVVLVTGDGAFGFYASEFNAAALSGLKIVCIISNDGAWGTEKHGQINSVGRSVNCELGQWDYHLIGEIFGGRGEKVDVAEKLGSAIERGFSSETFSIINVLTDPMAGLLRKQDPRVQMIAFEDLVSSLKTHYIPEVE